MIKSTGIIRRIDDLGRIALPKDIRRQAMITEGTPMQIFVDPDKIILKKYQPSGELRGILSVLSEAVDDFSDGLSEEEVSAIKGHLKDIRNILK